LQYVGLIRCIDGQVFIAGVATALVREVTHQKCVCLFVCLLADIVDKQQGAGQSVHVQISASLAGGRSAYQHRYAGL